MTDENPPILYNADGILAVDKPAGYETVALGGGKCLTRALRERLGDANVEAMRTAVSTVVLPVE